MGYHRSTRSRPSDTFPTDKLAARYGSLLFCASIANEAFSDAYFLVAKLRALHAVLEAGGVDWRTLEPVGPEREQG